MKKREYREVTQQEIVRNFNSGMSKSMLVKYVSGLAGIKEREALKVVEMAIYEDYMATIKKKR